MLRYENGYNLCGPDPIGGFGPRKSFAAGVPYVALESSFEYPT